MQNRNQKCPTKYEKNCNASQCYQLLNQTWQSVLIIILEPVSCLVHTNITSVGDLAFNTNISISSYTLALFTLHRGTKNLYISKQKKSSKVYRHIRMIAKRCFGLLNTVSKCINNLHTLYNSLR